VRLAVGEDQLRRVGAGRGDQVVVAREGAADPGGVRGEELGRRACVRTRPKVAAVEGGGDGVPERDAVVVGKRAAADLRWCRVDVRRRVRTSSTVTNRRAPAASASSQWWLPKPTGRYRSVVAGNDQPRSSASRSVGSGRSAGGVRTRPR
jgi:hypothetical protein